MIVADRREGGIRVPLDPHHNQNPLLRYIDRNVPLGIKLVLPVIVVTLAGTTLFALALAHQARQTIEDSYLASATASARASADAFYGTISDPALVDGYLANVASSQPQVEGIWIVDVAIPGTPVFASSITTDIGRTGLLDADQVGQVVKGLPDHQVRTVGRESVLETVVPVRGNEYAVVVWTSLRGADQAIASNLVWVVVAAAIVCALEVAAMTVILETGVLRRIRRVSKVVGSLDKNHLQERLSEGSEAEGRDALFNLARSLDHKLAELSQHERAGSVVSELGLLALHGAEPSELTRKALELTREAADLDRCFLIENKTTGAMTDSFDASGDRTSVAKLPIWLTALTRTATQSRRPVLAGSLGEEPRYWDATSVGGGASAAFIPLSGTPSPIGVMVGVARMGMQISNVSVSLMEAVATALGESLQRSEADKARHESDVKSTALATVSHEMRNPLNAMLGFSDLLLTGAAGPLNPKQEKYLRRVDDASKHLLRLVNDYLDLARVMAGSLPVQPEAVLVEPEVDAVLDLLRHTAEAKGVALRSEVSPGSIAHADRLRLRQVLMNLVSNGIKFTPARGHVRVEVAGGSNGVRISVIDTGIGIPADRQHLIFTEFAHLAPDGTAGGAGLGLTLTKRFVEAMGGFIRFTSSEGSGTIFDVWLPGEQTPRAGGADAPSRPTLTAA